MVPEKTSWKSREGVYQLTGLVLHGPVAGAHPVHAPPNRATRVAPVRITRSADAAESALASRSPSTLSGERRISDLLSKGKLRSGSSGGRGSGGGGEDDDPLRGRDSGRFLAYNLGEFLVFKNFERPGADPEHLRFRALPTCLAFCCEDTTVAEVRLAMGFATGDVLLVNPLNRNTVQYNKDGLHTGARVCAVRWIPNPGTPQVFVVAHSDGALFFYDATLRDDAALAGAAGKDADSGPFSIVKGKSGANPLAKWKLSAAAILDIAFSPDGAFMATAGGDGLLRVFRLADEALVMTFRSYFGAFLCVDWSPDGKFLLSGGEDDLVSVWSFHDRVLVARGEGHESWVSDVAFDPFCDRAADSEAYRIGSVGQDTRLILWDFCVDTLCKPRSASEAQPQAAPQQQPVHVPAAPMAEVPTLEPLLARKMHAAPIASLVFLEDCILTSCCAGEVKVWTRPGFDPVHAAPPPAKPAPADDDAPPADAKESTAKSGAPADEDKKE